MAPFSPHQNSNHSHRIGTRMLVFGFLSLSAWQERGEAGVTVNAPISVTHRVQIQPIVTNKTGGPPAVYFGNAISEAYIKQEINDVWAQSGVVIEWLPEKFYTNDFAYDGSPTDYSNDARPTGHLNTIVDNAPVPPRSPDATIISMFFVEIVPGFDQLSNNSVNGLAFIDGNGSAVHVGSNLLNGNGGRDIVASVVAHEIGHNLGLSHSSGGGASNNLMTSGSDEERLTSSQTATIFEDDRGIDGYEILNELAAESNYTQWADAQGLTEGPEGDDDRDGIANVIEFMVGLQGNAHDQLPAMVSGASGLTWTLPKNSAALDDGLSYQIEVSKNGIDWYPAGASAVPSAVLTDNSSQLTVRLDAGEEFSAMRFAVNIPPGLEANLKTFIPLPDPAGAERRISSCSHGSCGCRTLGQP